jgi:hypothetical protein
MTMKMLKVKFRRYVARSLMLSISVLGMIAATTAAPLELPALMQPASGEHYAGKVIWLDLVTPDLAAAKRSMVSCSAGRFRKSPKGAPGTALRP